MGNEAIDYAKALAAELNHLDERWDAANRTVQTLDREITTVRDKMLEVVKSLGGVVVIGTEVYVAETDGRLVALEGVVAGQPQGQGHYDPATQSVVRWHRFGDRTPPEDKLVLVRRAPNGLTGVTGQTGEEFDYLPDDLWAELPQPPRSES
jgi:hypothetical protein